MKSGVNEKKRGKLNWGTCMSVHHHQHHLHSSSVIVLYIYIYICVAGYDDANAIYIAIWMAMMMVTALAMWFENVYGSL